MGKRNGQNGAGNLGASDVVIDDDPPVDTNAAGNGAGNGQGNAAAAMLRNGGCIPCTIDELEDLIDGLRVVPGGRVAIDRYLRNGVDTEHVGRLPAVDFSFDDLVDKWGPGRYRIYGRVDGESRASFKRIITIAGAAAARNTPAAVAPGLLDPRAVAAQPPAYYPHAAAPVMPPGYPPGYPPAYYPPPPQPAQDMSAIFQLMLNQAKQQSDLVVAMLSRQVEASSKAPHVTELGELLKLAKELSSMNRGKGGGDDDDGDSIVGNALGTIGAAFVKQWQLDSERRLNEPQPQSTAIVTAATPSPTTPAVVDVGQAAGAPPTAQHVGPRRSTPALDPHSVGAKVRRIVGMVLATADDAQRDPAAFADVAISILGDDLAEQMIASTAPGQLAAGLVEQFPQLTSSTDFLIELEMSIRQQFTAPAAEPTAGAADLPPLNDAAAASAAAASPKTPKGK